MFSIVIYFHSYREKNLEQTLRFLNKRESRLGEIVLICQDSWKDAINLNLPFYHKAKMCNIGVDKAKNDIVVLLDSDRILPQDYFSKYSQNIKPNQFLSTNKLYRLNEDYTDEQIDKLEIKLIEDFKSKSWEPCKKNLFAGNTMFFKEDYWKAGGMDEKYVGYGFCDTDMTYNIMNNNFEVQWNDEMELHLSHPHTVMCGEKEYDSRVFLHKNINRFYNKWGLPLEDSNHFLKYHKINPLTKKYV